MVSRSGPEVNKMTALGFYYALADFHAMASCKKQLLWGRPGAVWWTRLRAETQNGCVIGTNGQVKRSPRV